MNSQESNRCYHDGPIDDIDDELDVVVDFPAATNNGKRKKEKNFTPEEDVVLLKSYFEISHNPITSTDQKSGTMWASILELYTNYIDPTYPARSAVSLTNRWGTIQGAVNKFKGVYDQIKNRNDTGTSPLQQYEEALIMYRSIQKGPFNFKHCYELMKKENKWKDNKTSKKRLHSSCSPHLVELDNDNSDKPFETTERPIGRKAAKEILKKQKGKAKEGDAFLEDWKELRQKMHDDKMKLQEEKTKKFLDLERKKFQHQQMLDETKIILMDTSGLDAWQLQYVQSVRAKIIARDSQRCISNDFL